MTHKNTHLSYYDDDTKVEAYIKKDSVFADLTRAVLKNLFDGIPKNARVLDVGCGYGRDVSLLREQGYDAHGIDESEAMIRAAINRYGPYFQTRSVFDIDPTSGCFDVVHSRNMLVHVYEDDLTRALKALYDMTKPDGTLMIISKNGTGVTITNTTGQQRETRLHDKDKVASILINFGAQLLEPAYLLESPSANGDRLFVVRACKK